MQKSYRAGNGVKTGQIYIGITKKVVPETINFVPKLFLEFVKDNLQTLSHVYWAYGNNKRKSVAYWEHYFFTAFI